MRTVDARISVPGIPLGALLRWIGVEEEYGPRKRSPLKWMRCVGLPAHHTSSPTRCPSGTCASPIGMENRRRTRGWRSSSRRAGQVRHGAARRPGPCEDAASSSTSQCLSRRYTTRAGILPCSSTKTPSSARPVSSNSAHFESASPAYNTSPPGVKYGQKFSTISLSSTFWPPGLSVSASPPGSVTGMRCIARAASYWGLQPGHISEIRGEHCLKLAGTRFADHGARGWILVAPPG